MDGEPIRVFATLEGKMIDSTMKLTNCFERFVSVLERLETPLKFLLIGVGCGFVAMSAAHIHHTFSKNKTEDDHSNS